MFFQAENLSSALILLSRGLVERGIDVTRRGFQCREFPGAVLIEISNPTDRYVRIPERKWNKTLGWIESLWLARGDNSLEMPASYVKNLLNFSDDGKFMRAGYGPRIRRYGDNFESMVTLSGQLLPRQYKNGKADDNGRQTKLKRPTPYQNVTDQLRFVIEKFKQDIDTREAVITIHDPISDNFNAHYQNEEGGVEKATILETKDTPCTRSIHFMVVDGKMNCYVDMRSNDLIWGFSAVNVFNFTLMQEYVAAIVGVPVGKYYHKADNLHVYKDFIPLVEEIAKRDPNSYPSGVNFSYKTTFSTLEEFDELIAQLSIFEEHCRLSEKNEDTFILMETEMFEFTDEMFLDWAKVIYRYWTKKPVEFKNPLLNELFIG